MAYLPIIYTYIFIFCIVFLGYITYNKEEFEYVFGKTKNIVFISVYWYVVYYVISTYFVICVILFNYFLLGSNYLNDLKMFR
jgi:hypothetical protein